MEKREIKFRAWDNDRNQFVIFGNGHTLGKGYHLSPSFTKQDDDVISLSDKQYYQNHFNLTWLQFTGLRDKNGAEIYEGDLLRYPGDPNHFTAYEVFFHDGDANSDFNIGYSCGRTHHQGSICGGPIPSFKPKSVAHMEICGNIFQNPELLTPIKHY